MFANPYLACDICQNRVTHKQGDRNQPCGHLAGFESVCPSWSPVDGCRCQEHFGYVPHLPELETTSRVNVFEENNESG